MPYIALIAAVVDTSSGRIEVSAAGINQPLITRANSRAVTTVECGGPPLGVIENYPFENHEAELDNGDVLALYSDGLVEARSVVNPSDRFGDERLAALLKAQAARRSSLSEVSHEIVEQVRQYAGGSIDDDVCLLLAKRIAA
jgi:serine phosphatase RsbU (regulator of sigma subunit)